MCLRGTVQNCNPKGQGPGRGSGQGYRVSQCLFLLLFPHWLLKQYHILDACLLSLYLWRKASCSKAPSCAGLSFIAGFVDLVPTSLPPRGKGLRAVSHGSRLSKPMMRPQMEVGEAVESCFPLLRSLGACSQSPKPLRASVPTAFPFPSPDVPTLSVGFTNNSFSPALYHLQRAYACIFSFNLLNNVVRWDYYCSSLTDKNLRLREME